jgi:hypothetical protein
MLRATSQAVTVLTAFAVTAITSPPGARAQEPPLLLLLVPGGADAQDYKAVELALEAHLTSFAFDVVATPVDRIPGRLAAQEKLARRSMAQAGARFAIWIDAARREATLVQLDADDTANKLRRRFGCIARSVPECGDALASMVSSAVSSWLGPPADEPGDRTPGEPAFDNELSPMGLYNLPWKEPEPVVRLQVGAGYGAVFFNGTTGASHGFLVDVSVIAIRYLLVEAGLDFFWRLSGDSMENGGTVTIGRVDLAALIGGVLPLDRWSVAATAGVIADFVEVRAHSENLALERDGGYRIGFGARLVARVRFNRWLGLAFGGGVDAFESEASYGGTGDDGVEDNIIRLGPVQGRVLVSLETGVGLGRARDR